MSPSDADVDRWSAMENQLYTSDKRTWACVPYQTTNNACWHLALLNSDAARQLINGVQRPVFVLLGSVADALMDQMEAIDVL